MTATACNFCGKRAREVRAMVEGPNVRICGECVELCWLIVRPEPGEPPAALQEKSAGGDGDPVSCSFCGRREGEFEKLIAGVETFICDQCIGKARADLDVRGESGQPKAGPGHYCSLCGKHESEVARIVAGPQGDGYSTNICCACVALCRQVLGEPQAEGHEDESVAGEGPGAGEYPELYCSFCGKPYSEVGRVIAGPTVFICRGCVEVCVGLCAGNTDSGDGPDSGA